jgi:uncharacterized protein DUF4129
LIRSPRFSLERRLAAALLLAGAVLLAPVGAQPQPAGPAEVRAKAQKILADRRLQRALPEHPAPSDDGLSERPFHPIGAEVPAAVPMVVSAGAYLAQTVFLVLLIVVALLLAVWLAGKLPSRRSAEQADTAREREDPTGAAEREPAFEDAARLAGEGRYAEAIHALLLATIRYFAERSRTAVPPSRTSRELIRLLPLRADTREAFAELVRDVELSLFGGAPVSSDDYERSLSRFRLLTRRPA